MGFPLPAAGPAIFGPPCQSTFRLENDRIAARSMHSEAQLVRTVRQQSRSAAERARPGRAVAQRVTITNHRPATAQLAQLAAILNPPPSITAPAAQLAPAPSRTGPLAAALPPLASDAPAHKTLQRQSSGAVVQRVLKINNSPASPFSVLKYGQFQSLRKRQHGLTVDGWQWLKAMARTKETYEFSGWNSAISVVKDLKWNESQFLKFVSTMRRPHDPDTYPGKYGETPSHPATMKDAHGFVEMVNFIKTTHPIASSVYVSPGASADPFAMALRVQGAKVVEIPLSGIKRENLSGETHGPALAYVKNCFAGIAISGHQIVIFDAVISGDALVILKELISAAFKLPLDRISLVGLNNPGKPSAARLQEEGELVIVPNMKHARFAKQRVKSQSYKLDIFGRIFPKYELTDLTMKSAQQTPAPNTDIAAKILSLVMAMRVVANEPYVEKEPEPEPEDE